MGNAPSFALHSASLSGDDREIHRALERGAAINDLRVAPLHGAALFGHTDSLRALVDIPGVDLDRQLVLCPRLFPKFDASKHPFPECLMTPLGCAILNGSLDAVELLVSRGATVNAIDNVKSPLVLAICSHTDTKILEYLLDAGAYTGGSDLVMLAAIYGNVAAMDVVWARGITTDLERALTNVVSKEYRQHVVDLPGTVRWLIDHGAIVSHTHRLFARVMDARCVETFEIVVDAFRRELHYRVCHSM